MNLQKIGLSSTSLQLSHSLNERGALDIANCTAQLNDADVGTLICIINWYSGNPLDPVLDCVCKVWHNLDGFSKIVTTTLTLDYVLVDLSCRDIVLASKCDVEIALVVAKVEVDFTAIVEDENFTVPMTTSTTPQRGRPHAKFTLLVP